MRKQEPSPKVLRYQKYNKKNYKIIAFNAKIMIRTVLWMLKTSKNVRKIVQIYSVSIAYNNIKNKSKFLILMKFVENLAPRKQEARLTIK